jgi:hypothetical protein
MIIAGKRINLFLQNRLNCKKLNCQRTVLKLGFSESWKPVIRAKCRHDGEKQTAEFDFEEIQKEFEKMQSSNSLI